MNKGAVGSELASGPNAAPFAAEIGRSGEARQSGNRNGIPMVG
jgi:hypothetical protein